MNHLPTSAQSILPIFSEPKLLILHALFTCESAPCGCDLVDRLELSKNLLSYHLKGLRNLGFIEETSCGRQKQYRLRDDKRGLVEQALRITNIIST